MYTLLVKIRLSSKARRSLLRSQIEQRKGIFGQHKVCKRDQGDSTAVHHEQIWKGLRTWKAGLLRAKARVACARHRTPKKVPLTNSKILIKQLLACRALENPNSSHLIPLRLRRSLQLKTKKTSDQATPSVPGSREPNGSHLMQVAPALLAPIEDQEDIQAQGDVSHKGQASPSQDAEGLPR